ncbi:monovalent cation:proton antiporter-2 (CPA2) family protein [Blastochloris viridis]|uniref:K(+)/H(+) antiporter n=1 Tax=Blastochloris viridis TaxID=1079 RepID=A0A0H5BAC5_BLAVI|nr:monovalent cation:proton antiporter-2 (CPA2) family protein [Blastochloris viridis]ALK10818.1 Glutathione-regulated potassium-efflux system protein KefC [Blastochloris viridis]BAR99212.1 putative Glutathione-regulated potassium-efflux system protein KefB [Blastochloris viridis]CUU43480.1 K(+)/H(+) antiporter [Blastochloris viridis]
MHADGFGLFEQVLVLLGAAVLAVPLAKRARLGSIVGYLLAGVAIGPQALGLFHDPGTVSHLAELGIVFFLFLIGLEMKPSRLWKMRGDILGLGGAQMLITGATLMCVPLAFGRPFDAALVAGLGLALSSTAILMQILEERGEVRSAHGRRAFAVAIFQDVVIVPILALVAFLSPHPAAAGEPFWLSAVKIISAIAAVVVIGRYLLNPMFRALARSGAREIMTAAALLVVLGSATLMMLAGLSMAMGAFLAGVFLAESNFRHQIEADVEPFRGILMGLFFLSVGMALDLNVIAESYWRIGLALAMLVLLKATTMYVIMRLFRHDREEAVRVALLMAQSGELGFVVYAAAVSAGVIGPDHASILVAMVVMSMAVNPFLYRLAPLLTRRAPTPIVEDFSDARGSVLVIGFGRFGQVASQCLLTNGYDVTIIDNDAEMVQSAGRFGFKVYYGDGTRLDVLRAAGGDRVRLVAVCVDDRDDTDRIVDIVRAAFPVCRLYVRAYDRGHSLELLAKGVDFEVRETYESAIAFGRGLLVGLGADDIVADEVVADVRRRDAERLVLQQAQGFNAGAHLLHYRRSPVPEPLLQPGKTGRALNPEAEDALTGETEYSG